jgi:TolB-like protein/DNA-binding winged helix-turn-helix (wHTH) protein/Tfp pilus assembly protein PilF
MSPTVQDRRESIQFGVYSVDLRAGELRKQGTRIKLQERPFQILTLLLTRAGDVVTREEIRAKLWPEGTFVDFDHGISSAVNRLRETLGDSASRARYIETVGRRGYRFIYPITSPPEPAVDTSGVPSRDVSQTHLSQEDVQLSPVATGTRPSAWRKRAFAVASLLTVSVVVIVAVKWRARDVAPSRIRSIAVLPFANLSNDPRQEYFADGVTEALITGLSRVSALRVISRTSVMHYKGSKATLPEIAHELKVDGIIEGSVQRQGERVNITAQLIRASDDTHLWANTYERTMSDILGVQEEVARAVAEEVNVSLTPNEKRQLSSAHAISPRASDLYFRAKQKIALLNSDGAVEAIYLLQEAINIDQSYAPFYEALAEAYYYASNLKLAPEEAMPKARAAAETALALEPSLSGARTTLALVAGGYDRNWAEAEQQFKRAVNDNPGQALPHAWYGDYLMELGRPIEGMAELERAIRLDPLSLQVNYMLGMSFYLARDFDRAIHQFHKTLTIDPNSSFTMWTLGQVYESEGDFPEALAWYTKSHQLQEDPLLLAQIGGIYARTGKKQEARDILNQLIRRSKRQHIPPNAFGVLYFYLGDKDKAFEDLNRAVDEHAEDLTAYKVAPWVDPLRSDPRFQAVLRRMKFPD